MEKWPYSGGEMARRIHEHDWSSTPLGAIESWSQVQRTAVDMMLSAGHAMQLAWGPERIVLYNDLYAPMLGDRHPPALGIPLREAWPEICREADCALVEVGDTGIGIPAEELNRVCDLFAQVRNQQPYSAGGLGIGLSLVKQLVEMHGGVVAAASDGPGRGSTFSIRLPIAFAPPDAAPAKVRDAAGELAQARNLRVLIVDDQRDSADSLAQLLRLEGVDAEPTYGGEQALAQAKRVRPDLVLLDLGMPGMDGFEVARRLRAEFADRPAMQIVALTGWGQESDRQRTQAAGVDGHLAKAASAADLRTELAHASRADA